MDKFLVPNQSYKVLEQISDEFLNALLQEEILYPWNPLDEDAQTYLSQQEQDISLADSLSSEDINTQIETFFQSLDN